MTVRDLLFVGFRHMKSGIVGVLLVVFATAIGVALAASTNGFIRAYRQQTRTLLNNPGYREVRVAVRSIGDSILDLPVRETAVKDAGGGSFTSAEMKAAAEASPAAERAYIVERIEMFTTAAIAQSEKAQSGGVRGASDKKTASEEESAATKNDERGVLYELLVESFPTIRTTGGFFEAYDMAVAEGFLFTQDDLEAGNLVIVLGSELANTIFPNGDAIGTRISLYYETFTVIGMLEPSVLEDSADLTRYNEMAYVPQSSLEEAWGKRLGITDMRFTAYDSSAVRAAVNQLTTYFESVHPQIAVHVTDAVAGLRKERLTLSRVIAVLVFLSGLGLFIAAINLLNLMLIRIIKHTKGIGIMRALGTTRREIFMLFAAESVLMCVTGAIIGLTVSSPVYRLLQSTIISGPDFSSSTFSLDLVLGAVVGFLFSAAFGLYPAFVAMNTDTTLALRAE